MNNSDTMRLFNGKWPGILLSLGATEQQVSGKHAPCPMCDGKDRFRLVEKDGKAFWICNQCGSGDGMDLAMAITGQTDFGTMADRIKDVAPTVQTIGPAPVKSKKDREEMRRDYVQLWRTAKERNQEPLFEYMKSRGIDGEWVAGADLAYHPDVAYFDDDGKFVGRMPCMLSRVVTADGRLTGLHRTYLHKKKDGSYVTKKKITKVIEPLTGGAVRLFGTQGSNTMIVAEGIESALSMRILLFGETGKKVPCWASISANNMEKMVIPDHVENILIAGDWDSNFTGQKAAYTLANRLVIRDKKNRVAVRHDWGGMNDANDKLNSKGEL